MEDEYGGDRPLVGGNVASGGGGGAPAPPPPAAAPAAVLAGGAPRAYPIPARSYALAPRPGFVVKRGFTDWDIDHERFEIKKELGKGSYGAVVSAVDHLTGQKVAIKKINDIFSVFENAKRIYREVRKNKYAPTRPLPPPPLHPAPHPTARADQDPQRAEEPQHRDDALRVPTRCFEKERGPPQL